MLIESEHNMAREDKEGSEMTMEFTAFASYSCGNSNLRVQESEEKTFLILVKGRAL
jgi:hypothetical protein